MLEVLTIFAMREQRASASSRCGSLLGRLLKLTLPAGCDFQEAEGDFDPRGNPDARRLPLSRTDHRLDIVRGWYPHVIPRPATT